MNLIERFLHLSVTKRKIQWQTLTMLVLNSQLLPLVYLGHYMCKPLYSPQASLQFTSLGINDTETEDVR